MSARETDRPVPPGFVSLMRDDRVYSSSPLWRVSVSPGKAIIGIRPQWRLGITHSVLFALLGIGLFGVVRWFSVSGDLARICTWGAWFCWFMAVAFMAGTLLFEKYRSRKAWFICHLSERRVSCPRLGKAFQLDEVHALQLLTGKATRPDPEGRTVMVFRQLNLIAEEGGRLQRYPLIGDSGPGRLSRHAARLAAHCGIPLLKDDAPHVADWA